jgi:protein-disulfide isomerase
VQILEAARLQGKYWPALERALADQPRWAAHGSPRPELIWESIADTGLDMAKARADAASPAIADALRQDIADMKALKVRATPGFFVNGRPLTDFGEAQLRALISEELAKVRKP